jgi:hypothetical protein
MFNFERQLSFINQLDRDSSHKELPVKIISTCYTDNEIFLKSIPLGQAELCNYKIIIFIRQIDLYRPILGQ